MYRFFVLVLCSVLLFCTPPAERTTKHVDVLASLENSMKKELLDVWYPRVMDSLHGGFLSTFTFDFKPTGDQDKMIVTQARHIWTTSKASIIYPDNELYLQVAGHGFNFLRGVMWDRQYGGFHTLVARDGTVKGDNEAAKTAYGNSFAIYALASYYAASRDTAALNLAKKTFLWLEKHSHDKKNKGYFQHLTRSGDVISRTADMKSTAETGYKDQNSSIHLLEAFTELYQVWPDELLRERLREMLVIIRDRIVQPQGYMSLFFHPDWTPVTYRDSSEAVIMKHHGLDHVSFGHDVEIAFLMLEASHVLGINDAATSTTAKRLVDHALANGWDREKGGFYDGGYYFKNRSEIAITMHSKNWWTQAEGLNSLLLMAELYPNDENNYLLHFKQLWDYTDTYLIDHTYGEWYQGGLDKEPHQKTALKAHIWKASYHQFRALSNCVSRLKNNKALNERLQDLNG
jgi:cellobiose epimerase